MPVELQWEPYGIYRRYFGTVSVQERRASFEQMCGDPRFDDLRYAITDYLAVSDYEFTAEATEETAARHIGAMRTNPRIVLASVTTDERIIAAIRHFNSLGFISRPYGIFSTIEGARTWCDAVRPMPHGWSRQS